MPRSGLRIAITATALITAACSGVTTEGPAAPTGASPRWTTRAGAPVQRTEVGAAVLNGKVWVLAGFSSDGKASADVAVYDPAKDAWSAGPALPEPLHHTAVAADGTRLWVVGGYTGTASAMAPTNAVRVLDPGGIWRDGPTLPSPRAAGALAWDGKRLLYGGGVGPGGLAGDVFALVDNAWRRIGALSTAREHLAAASDGEGTTWFLAGRLGPLETNRADVDLVTGEDIKRIGAIPTARGGVAGFYARGTGACVVGGEQPSGTLDMVECISPTGTTAVLPAMAASRHGLGAVVLDGTAYTLLGGPKPGLTVSNTVEALRVG